MSELRKISQLVAFLSNFSKKTSKQQQQKNSLIYFFPYSLPDLTKSESENGNGGILVNTFLEIFKYDEN